ncbi:MAG: GIY-YIG nuclease family protein [Pseudolabrys sp.]
MAYYVYLLASERNWTLYVGVTNNVSRRVYEHKNKVVRGFTKNTMSGVWFGSKYMATRPTRFRARKT